MSGIQGAKTQNAKEPRPRKKEIMDYNAFVDVMEPNNENLKWPENATQAGLCFHIRIFDGRIDFEAMRYEDPDNEIDCLDLDPDDCESEFDDDIIKVLHENGYRLTSDIHEDGDLLLFTCAK